MNQIETALVTSGLVTADQTQAAKVAAAAKIKAKKVARARALKIRNDLVVSLLPFGALGSALIKAKKGKRSQAAIKLAISSAQAQIARVNLTIRALG